jgi:hypothetical protein
MRRDYRNKHNKVTVPAEDIPNIRLNLQRANILKDSQHDTRDVVFEKAGNSFAYTGRPTYVNSKGDLYLSLNPGAANSDIRVIIIPFNRHKMTREQAMIYVNKANRAARASEITKSRSKEMDSHINITIQTNSGVQEKTAKVASTSRI